jgi:acyl-CoA thioesterase I
MLNRLARYGVVLTLFQALIACGNSPAQEPPQKTPQAQYDTLVVAFGDSLYAGYQLSPTQGLAPQLQAALAKAGINARVFNAGVSGDTTAAGKARLAFVLDNIDKKPDLVVLGLGGNDMLRGIKPSETKMNLAAMLDELKKRDVDVVMTGMVAAPNLGADYARAFNAIYPALAAQYDIALMPFFLGDVVQDKNLMLPDAIHPNAKGVAKVVEKLTPLVEQALNLQKPAVLKK